MSTTKYKFMLYGSAEKSYAKIFCGKMQKNASITWKAHWIVQKFQQLAKLITKPFEYT